MHSLITVSDIRLFRSISESINLKKVNLAIQESQNLDLKPILNEALYFDFHLQTFADRKGTISSVGTAVTGSGTTFTTDLVTGDYIAVVINKIREYRQITILTDTTLTLASAFSVDQTGVAYFTTLEKYFDLLFGKDYIYQGDLIHYDGVVALLSYSAWVRITELGDIHTTNAGSRIKSTEVSTTPNQDAIKGAIGLANGAANSFKIDTEKFLDENISIYILWSKGRGESVLPQGSLRIFKL